MAARQVKLEQIKALDNSIEKEIIILDNSKIGKFGKRIKIQIAKNWKVK